MDKEFNVIRSNVTGTAKTTQFVSKRLNCNEWKKAKRKLEGKESDRTSGDNNNEEKEMSDKRPRKRVKSTKSATIVLYE